MLAPNVAGGQQTPAGPADSVATAPSESGRISITRGSHPSSPGPAENFTGEVSVQPLFAATDSSRAAGASVTFEPGARSAWHTHPRGQVLIVTAGVGRIQEWGERVREIRAGDVAWTPPGVKHWHGASPDGAMTHLAIHEHTDGEVVEWLEKVTDEQYRQPLIEDQAARTAATPAGEPLGRSKPPRSTTLSRRPP
jgi:quercetin dioxygenase-like cupin family protein